MPNAKCQMSNATTTTTTTTTTSDTRSTRSTSNTSNTSTSTSTTTANNNINSNKMMPGAHPEILADNRHPQRADDPAAAPPEPGHLAVVGAGHVGEVLVVVLLHLVVVVTHAGT